MKTPILTTGMSGLVGSRIVELLQEDFEFTDLSLTTGVDITNPDEVEKHVKPSKAKIILHLAAKADVDACEDDKIFGEEGQAWQVNVMGTENIISSAQKTNKRVIYISTDFVFDGTKDVYNEEDTPNPVNWYGMTKYEGEKLIQSAKISSTIVRIAYPYRSFFPEKKDFVRRILEKLKRQEKIQAITDHIFTPTFIDDLAQAVKLLMLKEFPGIYHVVGSGSLTTYEAAKKIADEFSFKSQIEPVNRDTYFTRRGRAFRPFKLALKNDKISQLGIIMNSFSSGLAEVKEQLKNSNSN